MCGVDEAGPLGTVCGTGQRRKRHVDKIGITQVGLTVGQGQFQCFSNRNCTGVSNLIVIENNILNFIIICVSVYCDIDFVKLKFY